jgi:hypothetical protein
MGALRSGAASRARTGRTVRGLAQGSVAYTAYLALSLTDPALAIAPLVKNSDTVTGVVAARLRAARAAGDTPARLDPDVGAFSLMARSAGLATSVLAGQSSIQQAQASSTTTWTTCSPHPSRPYAQRPRNTRVTRRTSGLALSQYGVGLVRCGQVRPGSGGSCLARACA